MIDVEQDVRGSQGQGPSGLQLPRVPPQTPGAPGAGGPLGGAVTDGRAAGGDDRWGSASGRAGDGPRPTSGQDGDGVVVVAVAAVGAGVGRRCGRQLLLSTTTGPMLLGAGKAGLFVCLFVVGRRADGWRKA